MSALIELKQVYKAYANQTILENISLSIEQGEFLTLLGPSGCGKTTLLRLISGFETPDSGDIIIGGNSVLSSPPHLRQVNTVFQSYALFPHMTVFENVAFGLYCEGIAKNEIHQRVNDTLKKVKLADLANRKPSQISGGQQQRVAIARAIVKRPLVLLLDEPLSALDYSLRKAMQIELKQLQRQLGIAFIFVTHDQEEALSLSDRIVVFQNNQIQQIGSPREVYEKPCNLAVAKFIGEANILDTEIEDVNSSHITATLFNKKMQLKHKT